MSNKLQEGTSSYGYHPINDAYLIDTTDGTVTKIGTITAKE